MNSSQINDLWERLDRQRRFFDEGQGHLLVFASYPREACAEARLYGPGQTVSETFLRARSYEMGVERVRNVKAGVIDQMEVGDDSVVLPFWGLVGDWGTGHTAALYTGGDLVFEEDTSYTVAHPLSDWDRLDQLDLGPKGRWVEPEVDFWRGVFSEYEEGLPATVHNYRSPLDLANDLRGNALFVDLHTQPERVHALLGRCTEAIIDLDRFFRDALPEFRRIPGGAWGVALPTPGMIFLNGDPIDLVSEEMAQTFSHSYTEQIAAYAGALYFHHHSIGVERARGVSNIEGLTVQEILQDPNGPRLAESVDDDLLEASLRTPIDLTVFGLNRQTQDWRDLLARLAEGRFIVHLEADSAAEARALVSFAKGFAGY